jgi:probable rRNA maturation factor
MAINFFSEDVKFSLPNKLKRKAWLKNLAKTEGLKINDLSYIFCSDEYLHKMNLDYLDHDTFTDIITFDNSEEEKLIEGDIFISIDRVRENAKHLNLSEEAELSRVIGHGLFHLMGYKDKTETQILEMREKEESAIELFDKI